MWRTPHSIKGWPALSLGILGTVPYWATNVHTRTLGACELLSCLNGCCHVVMATTAVSLLPLRKPSVTRALFKTSHQNQSFDRCLFQKAQNHAHL